MASEPRPSKSAQKRDHQAAQELGDALVALPEARLDEIPLSDALRDAVRDAARMTSHGARRRQRKLIGKLIAREGAGDIRSALDAAGLEDRQEKALFREAERWRDRIVSDGSEAVRAFAAASGADGDSLHALFAEFDSCQREATRRRLRREIFRAVRAGLERGMRDADRPR